MDNNEFDERFRKMAQEVIEQALSDIKRGKFGQKDEAIKWFNERSTIGFGYGWCLGLSGYNPNTIRRIINKIAK